MTRLMVGMVGVVMVVASGCATKMGVQQQEVVIAGRTFHYVSAEAKDPAGVNFSVMDRYDSDGKLVARDAASGNGILHAVIPAVIDGAATAGGLIGAAAVLRPDTTNVTQTTGGTADGASAGGGSDSGNSGSGSSGTTTITVSPTVTTSSTASPVNTSSSKATATAASASNQSQSQTASNMNTNHNANINSNSNRNTNTNSNTNKSSGNTKTHTNHGHHYGHDKDKGDK